MTRTMLSVVLAITMSVMAIPIMSGPEPEEGSEWNIQIVDSADHVGGYTSIALDSNDNPHISYANNTNRDLKYAKWTGNDWSIETVDSYGDVGFYSSIALDSNGYPHIAYLHMVSNLKYAKWNGSAWNIEVVDSEDDVGHHNSIALDNNDHPHISYYDRTSEDLKYARWNGSAWNIEVVDSTDAVGYHSSLVLDRKDYPYIGYVDSTNGDLKLATKAALGPPHGSIGLDIDPDTLNLKSKGRWISAYLTAENANAEDIDAPSLLLNDAIAPAWWDLQNETTLMVKFDRAAVQAILPISDTVDIKVAGQWKDGLIFEVHDIIRVINPGR